MVDIPGQAGPTIESPPIYNQPSNSDGPVMTHCLSTTWTLATSLARLTQVSLIC